VNTEFAWAAGLYEGEGSCVERKYGWTLVVPSTDHDVLERFHAAVGCGKVFGPYQPKRPGSKRVWKWMCSDKAGIERFGERIFPMLMPRRRMQVQRALDHVATVKGRRSSCF
jgi:hypothetical protein